MKLYVWVIIILAILIIAFMVLGLLIVLAIIKPKRRSLLETSVLEEEKFPGIMDFYKSNLTSQYKIKSRYGYDIQVYFLKNKENSKRFIIMSHGHTYTHHGCLKYARMMMKNGFNIIMYDQRFHGSSGGKFTSLGYYEQDDLHDIITDTFTRYGNIILGLYGESMGAATVLLEAKNDNRIKYIFADCGFSNFESLLKEILNKNTKKLYKYFLISAKWIFQIIVKTKINRISPEDALNTLSIPIFFAHGEADDFISVDHTLKMYQKYPNDKEIFIGKNDAKHAMAYFKNPIEYEAKVKDFIEKFID